MYSRENLDNTLCTTKHVSLLFNMRLPTFESLVKAHGCVDDTVGEVCIETTGTYPLQIHVSLYFFGNIVHLVIARW